jgi:hypothetical protein
MTTATRITAARKRLRQALDLYYKRRTARNGGRDVSPPGEMPELDDLRTGTVLLRLQAAAADASQPELNWVNRRCERIDFLDTRAVRRRLSIDFHVPADAPSLPVGEEQFKLVPVTNLPKGNLVAFDLRDENDCALWLPALDYSTKFLARTMVYWAEQILGNDSLAEDVDRIVSWEPADHEKEWRPFASAAALIDARSAYRNAEDVLLTISGWLLALRSSNLREKLTWRYFRQLRDLQRQWEDAQRNITTADEDRRVAEQEWNAIAPDKQGGVGSLMSDVQFRSQLEELARNFVILAAVASPPKTRRIVKLAFENPAPFHRPPGLVSRLMQSIGWRSWRVDVSIGGRGGNHHLEAVAPAGVDIVRITVKRSEDGKPVERISAEGGYPRVHIRVPATAPYRSRARILLRVSRPGWLNVSWLVSLVIVAVMLAGRLRLAVIFSTPPGTPPGSEAGTAATLLLALLGVVAAVLARPGEHPLASRLLFLARLLILVDACVVLAATGALVLHRSDAPISVRFWNVLLVLAVVVAALLTISRFAPVMSEPRGIRRLRAMLSLRRGVR